MHPTHVARSSSRRDGARLPVSSSSRAGSHGSGRTLYLDDDPDACELAAVALRARGYDVVTETDAKTAIELALNEDFDVVVTDLHLGALDGLAVCERVLAGRPGLPVIVVTGHASMDAAIGSLRAGAYDFVTKPVSPEMLAAAVSRATQASRLREEVRLLQAAADTTNGVGPILGSSSAMRRVYDDVARIATTQATALIAGESGTGKELIARALHDQSRRAAGPFVAINCAAMPATLLESELFGHARGAFTDAKVARRGLFLDANGGTLFLDEIGDMPPEMQVKLLRALQERTVRPVGGSQEVPFDARIIAATNRDLEGEVEAKRFRADLYYRINVCTVHLPPLREREGDVALLAHGFVLRYAERHQKKVRGLTAEALGKLVSYDWPGNVRELENCMERAVAMTRMEQIVVDDLPGRIRAFRPETPQTTLVPETIDAVVTMDELEQRYIAHVLGLVAGNKSRAARLLGYDRRTLYRKLELTNGVAVTAEPSGIDAPPEALPSAERQEHAAPSPGIPGLPHVALVDGDEDARELLKLLLEGQGFVVDAFASPNDARSATTDVVVVSGSAGGQPPRSLLRPGGPPVVWITGRVDPEAETGFAKVLPKPVRVADLAATLRHLTTPSAVS